MTPRTPALPPTEPAMWRKLLARTHPDAGGEHELFVWATALKDHVFSNGSGPGQSGFREERQQSSRPDPAACVPYDPRLGEIHDEVIARAIELAEEDAPALCLALIYLLRDCGHPTTEHQADQERRGASYSMSKRDRVAWYRFAESIPMSMRMAGHIMGRMNGGR
jgi:hypothetical protein